MLPSIIIQLDDPARRFRPGEEIMGTFRFMDIRPQGLRRMEFSVLWYTEGKGDEDMGVHHFESISWDVDEQAPETEAGEENVLAGAACLTESVREQTSRTYSFQVPLPKTPLSYYGLTLKIRWCVRVRLFLVTGREIMAEKLFLLGDLPPVEVSLT